MSVSGARPPGSCSIWSSMHCEGTKTTTLFASVSRRSLTSGIYLVFCSNAAGFNWRPPFDQSRPQFRGPAGRQLWGTLSALFNSDLAPSTARKYLQGLRVFEKYRRSFGIPLQLPIPRDVIARFIARMTQSSPSAPWGLALSTMRGYLCALRDACKRVGFPDIVKGDWVLERLFRAARKQQARPVQRKVALVQP